MAGGAKPRRGGRRAPTRGAGGAGGGAAGRPTRHDGASAGRGGQPTAGRGGQPTAGRSSQPTAGRSGQPTAGRGGTPTAGRGGKPAAGRGGAAAAEPRAGAAPPPGPFRLGAIEGATPGKWIDTWHERMPRTPLDLTPLTIADQREALVGRAVDAALVRLPIDPAGLHVIRLYDEVPVVVCAADSHLTAAAELTVADLAGEVVIAPRHAPLAVEIPDAATPRFAPPDTVADAIATVAAGVGVVIVPMSLARLHHRKDVEYRPLAEGPASTVALAWRDEGAGDPLVEAFIGIVRGRTANSSRG
ncbi:LysR substrate-binding domain-containing protein [Microbacterium sp.]|uniref:LysR substrate-binding domain-containing protein n=1 Tax=Microbacterium sp. TaxID=51671 RepID=UPI0039E3E37C